MLLRTSSPVPDLPALFAAGVDGRVAHQFPPTLRLADTTVVSRKSTIGVDPRQVRALLEGHGQMARPALAKLIRIQLEMLQDRLGVRDEGLGDGLHAAVADTVRI